jgi:AcrR family transcriptional regulator
MTTPSPTAREDENPDELVRRVLDAARGAREGIRRENGREFPLGGKAARTRNALLAAAYDLFAAEGYQATSVADIAERAGVSLGAFYQYFRDRSDILGTLVRIGVLELLRGNQRRWDPARGRIGLRRVIAGFVEAYVSTLSFQAVWEEVTHVEEEMAGLRRDLSRLFTNAIEGAIAEGAEAGILRCDLDAGGMARALTAMVDRYCYVTYVFDPPTGGPPAVDDTADLLTELWADALGLAESHGRASP